MDRDSDGYAGTGSVGLQSSGWPLRGDTSVIVVPQQWQVHAGWVGAGLAMLIEAVTALAILVAIIGALS
ncbi:MAG: hypothetical protein IMY86_08950 [Chloroflexi bacterium]|nr:hypothetical protein [Chloroflexota bacterium]